ncbi:MAG: hypothetical protein EXR72_15880 [Myxococcales bacterium]|nr:hypothetical protein [Myxococcales bacterium]
MCKTELFASVRDLARLPFFELREGRLALRDRDLGPIIDVHSHLALAYVRPMQVDLDAAPRPTEHYMPLERRLDLDRYGNQNMSPEDLANLKRDLTLRSMTARGMRATHTVPNLTREMGEMGVAASLLLPIDFPVLSWNADAYLDVAARTTALPSLGSVHPYARDVAGKLRRQKARGARGIKFHPAVQLVAPDHPRALRLFHLCGEIGLPVLSHCGPVGIELEGARRRSQVWHFERAIIENPRTTFVLGHAGALQMEEALALAKRHTNVHLEISCQGLSNVKRILDEGPGDRVMLGSDWPFHHQAIPIAKALLATDGNPALRRKLLWENASRLFHIPVDEGRRVPVGSGNGAAQAG